MAYLQKGQLDSETLMGERVKVLDAALKALRNDKRLFATLADNAEVIEAAGNRLDTGGNEARAATAEAEQAGQLREAKEADLVHLPY